MKSIANICYCEEHEQYLDVHLPDCESFPVFIYFHGGGLETGDKSEQGTLYEYLTNHGSAVVTANYRLYPDAHYPDFLVDSAKAVSWTFKNIGAYGNATEIYIGDSIFGKLIPEKIRK